MNFKELIKNSDWNEVEQSLKDMYYNPTKVKGKWDEELRKQLETDEEVNKHIKEMLIGYNYVYSMLLLKRISRDKEGKKWKIHVKLVDEDYATDEKNNLIKNEDGSYKMEKIDEVWWDVSGTNGCLNKDKEDSQYFVKDINNMTDSEKEFMEAETTYAIEFQTWSNWLGMEVDENELNVIGKNNYISACLWEMTFCGFDQIAIKKQIKDLKKRVGDIKSGKAKLISYEDFKKQLEENYSKAT